MREVAVICLVLVTLFLASAILASPASAEKQNVSAWPMFHSDLAHSGYSNSQAPQTNQTLWKFNTGGQVDSATVVGGIVYVGSYDHKIYAFNASNGALIWNSLTGAIVISRPAAVNGVVYIGSEDHNLYAFNAANCC